MSGVLLVGAATIAGSGSRGLVAQALPKPDVGPEKPFAPPPRVERTLPNGLRVMAVRYGSVPKVSAILTVKSGLAVDPPAKAGLAQILADAAQGRLAELLCQQRHIDDADHRERRRGHQLRRGRALG